MAPDGTTVAVLGCGVDVVYPKQNRNLRDRVRQRGALVSEFPMGTQPLARTFPVRNRIIASLALGTLVVQATLRSGSLITARLALEIGRAPGGADTADEPGHGAHRGPAPAGW